LIFELRNWCLKWTFCS